MSDGSSGAGCPLCGSEGWPSSLVTGGFAGVCGSAWDWSGFARQSPACQIISGLRIELALADREGVPA